MKNKRGCATIVLAIVLGVLFLGFGGTWFVHTMKSTNKRVNWIRFIDDRPDSCLEAATKEYDDCDLVDIECKMTVRILVRNCLRSVYIPEDYCDDFGTEPARTWAARKCNEANASAACASVVSDELNKMCVIAPLKYEKQIRQDTQMGDIRASYTLSDGMLDTTIVVERETPITAQIELRLWGLDAQSSGMHCLNENDENEWTLPVGTTQIRCRSLHPRPALVARVRKLTATIHGEQ